MPMLQTGASRSSHGAPNIGLDMTREATLAQTLVELADTLVNDFDVVDLLTLLANRCVSVLDASAAGIMLAGPDGHLRPIAASSEAMHLLELFESQAQEGPCLDCYKTGAPVVASDLTDSDTPWPGFSPRAVEAGFQSATALPMQRRGTVIGALNFFRTDVGTIDDADFAAAQSLADIATIALMQHRIASEAQMLNEQLDTALQSRIGIEQAKGMIAERFQINLEQAFERLRTHARSNRIGISQVASNLTRGELPVSDL